MLEWRVRLQARTAGGTGGAESLTLASLGFWPDPAQGHLCCNSGEIGPIPGKPSANGRAIRLRSAQNRAHSRPLRGALEFPNSPAVGLRPADRFRETSPR
jgi:hypothetical protein